MPKQTVHCEYCNTAIQKYILPSTKTKRFFCCVEHKALYAKSVSYEELYGEEKAAELRARHSANNTGENNPNYGKRWTSEQKAVASAAKKEMYKNNPNIAYECGKSNRGKKFSEERIQRMHSHRSRDSYRHYPSDEVRRVIGEKSSAKWTDEYKQRHRKVMEEAGKWIPLDQKSDWEIYQKLANWKCRMWDIVDNAQEMLYTYGVFNYKTNTKGVVRDHIYGRRAGFFAQVFPEILRHPANCQVILHADNVAKKSKRYIDRNDISLERLFEAIKQYHKPWDEQELVLQLIQDYENGKRYERR